jgi:hypothetical protein
MGFERQSVAESTSGRALAIQNVGVVIVEGVEAAPDERGRREYIET